MFKSLFFSTLIFCEKTNHTVKYGFDLMRKCAAGAKKKARYTGGK
jgi:hypothetical protein